MEEDSLPTSSRLTRKEYLLQRLFFKDFSSEKKGLIFCDVCSKQFDGSSIPKLEAHEFSQSHIRAVNTGHTGIVGKVLENYPDQFKLNKNRLVCQTCFKGLSSTRPNVIKHFETDWHKRGLKAIEDYEKNHAKTSEEFNKEVLEMFVEMNLPLNLMNHPKFVKFCSNNTGHVPPSVSSSRREINKLDRTDLKKMRKYLKGKKLAISIDESTDKTVRPIVSTIVYSLETEIIDGQVVGKPGKIFLFDVRKLKAKDSKTYVILFNKIVKKLKCK